MRRVTSDQARRYALAAQGFNKPRPGGRVDVRHFRRVVDTVGLIQIDSVNYFSRAHFLPFFSRLGPYDRDALDRWLWRSGEMFEYWAHEASLLPSDQHRLFRWRMERGVGWKTMRRLKDEAPGYIEDVYGQVVEKGPMRAGELDDAGERSGRSMWNWNSGKLALEILFMEGRIATADRPNFVRMYDVADRVVSHQHLNAPGLSAEEAHAALLGKAAGAMGVATAEDLSDYYRIRMPEARPVIAAMAERGDLIEVEVEGWDKPGYLDPEATLPRKASGTALLSPFDNLVWFRPRVERIWKFHYRIEIYVPAPRRVYGYYVLPFLFDGDLVGRADVKTDRRAGVLDVKGAFAEPDVDRVAAGRAMRAELDRIASWLAMSDVKVAGNGNLAPYL